MEKRPKGMTSEEYTGEINKWSVRVRSACAFGKGLIRKRVVGCDILYLYCCINIVGVCGLRVLSCDVGMQDTAFSAVNPARRRPPPSVGTTCIRVRGGACIGYLV